VGQTVIPWTVLIPVLVALAGCAWFLIAEREVAGQWGYPLDDSWIYATYAKNLASGRGYAFNPGEHVAGATGPLYVFVLAILYYLFRDVLLPAKVLGILCLVASSLVIFQAMRRIDPKSAVTPVLAAALLALSPTLLWGTLSGLEIPLYLLVICMGIYFYVTERWTLAVLAWCVGVWFRPDGMVLALIGLFVRPRLSLKGLIAPCAVAGLIIGAYLAFNQVVGGWILPSSVEVNAHPGQDILPNLRGMAGQWSDLWLGSVGVRRVGVHSPLLLPAMVVGAWAIVRRWPALVAYFVLFPIAFALFTGFGGQFGRYLAPTIPFGTCLAAIGLGTVARRVPRGRSRVGMVAVLAICLVWQGYFARKVGIAYGWNVQNINGMQRFIAEKTRAATSPDPRTVDGRRRWRSSSSVSTSPAVRTGGAELTGTS
jgi:uncharacterized membrane protein YvlD (DUF360 family)